MPRPMSTPISTPIEKLITARVQRTIKCQLGGFESMEFSEALECQTTMSDYENTRKWLEEEVMRRLVASAEALLADVDLPTDGKSPAGQMALKLKG